MQWLDIKNQMRALMDELSSRGAILSATKVADILYKAKYFVNPVLYDLASTTAKLAASQNYTINPVLNTLQADTSSMKKHLPGADFSISLLNARSCFFEVNYPGVVVIEETSDNVTYMAIETITIPLTQTTLTEYKRLISPTLPTNTVRLRFTGSYAYDFRNYVLYPYTWPTEAEVQQNRPSFEFDLPADFLKLNQWMSKADSRQYVPYSKTVVLPTKRFAVNRYEAPLELQLLYWRKPTLLTFTGVDAVDDVQVLDCTEDAAMIVFLGVTSRCLISEKDETGGIVVRNDYEAAKASLPGNDNSFSGSIVTTLEY